MDLKLFAAIAAVSLLVFGSLVFAANNLPGFGAGFGAHARMGAANDSNRTPHDWNGTLPDFNGTRPFRDGFNGEDAFNATRPNCTNGTQEGPRGRSCGFQQFVNATQNATEIVAAMKQFRTAVEQGDFETATSLHAQYGFGGSVFGMLNESTFAKYSQIYSSSLDLWGELGLNCSEPGTCAGLFEARDSPGSARGWNPTPFRVHPHFNSANESDAPEP